MAQQGTLLRVSLSRDGCKAFSMDDGVTKTGFLSLEHLCCLSPLRDVNQLVSIEGCDMVVRSPVLQKLLQGEIPANSKQATEV